MASTPSSVHGRQARSSNTAGIETSTVLLRNRLIPGGTGKGGGAAERSVTKLIPGTRGNIDHLYVAATGVWVVDAKAYAGKVVQREVGPIWRRENEVFVGGRNRTGLARGVDRQVDAVIAALRPDESLRGINVHGALCFVESDWDLLEGALDAIVAYLARA